MKRPLLRSRQIIISAVLLSSLALRPALADDELELVLQTGHQGRVVDSLWLDDSRLVSGSKDGSLKLWDVNSRRVRRTLWDPSRGEKTLEVNDLELCPEGVWAAYDTGRVLLWDVVAGKVKRSIQLPKDVYWNEYHIHLDAKGNIYAWDDGNLCILDSQGKILDQRKQSAEIQHLVVSPDGLTMAYASRGEVTVISHGKTSTIPSTFANRWGIADLMLDSKNQRLYVSTSPGWLEGWDLGSSTPLFQTSLGNNPLTKEDLSGQGWGGQDSSVVLTPLDDNSLLATEHAGQVYQVDKVTGKWTSWGNMDASQLSGVAVNPAKDALTGGDSNTAVPLSVKSGSGLVNTPMGGDGDIFTSVALVGDKLVLASTASGIMTYDVRSGMPYSILPTGYFPAFATDGKRLFYGGNDGVTTCYDMTAGKELWTKDLTNEGARYDFGPNEIAVNPAADQIAVAVYQTRPSVLLMDASSGKVQVEIPSLNVDSLTFSSDGRQLFLAHNRDISLYDLNYHKLLHTWTLPGSSNDTIRGLVNHPTEDAIIAVDRRGEFYKFARNRLDLKPESVGTLDLGRISSVKPMDNRLLVCAGRKVYLCSTRAKVIQSYGDHLSTAIDAGVVENAVVTLGWDSMVGIWDEKTGHERAKLYSLQHGKDWLVTTPDFNFDGSQDAQNLLEWRWNGELYQVSRFFEKFYEPGLLNRVLRGVPVSVASQEIHERQPLGAKPPVVTIKQPKLVGPDEYEVELSIDGEYSGWDDVRLYHNGHRVPGKSPYRIKAVKGSNQLRASAFNADKTVESEPDKLTFDVNVPDQKSTLYVFAAAVNDYPNPLDFAVPDAKSFSEAFQPGLYDKVEKVVLLDKDATKESILAKLQAIPCQPQDTLLVFLAGHGTIIDNKFHYLPFGSTGTDAAKALSSQELGKTLAKLPATRQVLFLDTCHAGASAKDLAELLVERGSPLSSSAQGAQFIKDQKILARQAGTFLVAGSTPNATAAEVPQLGHGIFTYAVLNGLKSESGGPGKAITVNELLTYLNEKVPELSLKFRGSPLGIWQFSAGQDFPIAKP